MKKFFSQTMYVSATSTLTTLVNMEHEKHCMGLLKVSKKLLVPVYFRNFQNILSKSSNVHNLCVQIANDSTNKRIIAKSLKITTINFTTLLTQVAHNELWVPTLQRRNTCTIRCLFHTMFNLRWPHFCIKIIYSKQCNKPSSKDNAPANTSAEISPMLNPAVAIHDSIAPGRSSLSLSTAASEHTITAGWQ